MLPIPAQAASRGTVRGRLAAELGLVSICERGPVCVAIECCVSATRPWSPCTTEIIQAIQQIILAAKLKPRGGPQGEGGGGCDCAAVQRPDASWPCVHGSKGDG